MSHAISLTIRPVNPIREGLNALFRLKWPIIALCLALPLGAAGIGYMMTPLYQASSSLMVKTGREFTPVVIAGDSTPVAPSVTKAEIINSEVEILQSRKLAMDTINAVGMKTMFPDIADGDESADRKMDQAVQAFEGNFGVRPVKLSNVVDVSYRHPDRAISVQVLDTVLKLYMAQHVSVYSDEHSNGLEGALQHYTSEIRDLERQRTEILVKYDLSAPDHQRDAIITEQSSIDDRLQTLRDRAVEAAGKVKFYEQQLAHTPRMVTSQSSTSDAIEKARSQMIDLRLKESELAQHFTDNATPLQQVRNDIKVVQRFLGRNGGAESHVMQSSNPVYDDIVLSLSRSQADLNPINEQIGRLVASQQDLWQRLHQIEEGSQKLTDVQRQIDMLTAVLTTYRSRLENARIDETLDKNKDSSVSVISPPFAPDKIVFPSKRLFGLAGLVLAFVISGALWVYQLLFRSNLSTPESVERLLAIPVLMTVPTLPRAQQQNTLFQADPTRPFTER